MMTETQQAPTLAPSPPPEPITRAALDARIALQGHELVTLTSEDGATYVLCTVCGASVDEDAEGMDVDARLLEPCREPIWISYAWEGNESEGDQWTP